MDLFKDIKKINTHIHFDNRGTFEKIFPLNSINFSLNEIFYSKSIKGTIRGMHLQTHPYESRKIIKVIDGEIIDVILDTRKKSKTYGDFFSINLNEKSGLLIVPKGCSHGFQTLSAESTVLYLVDQLYNEIYDTGYRYNSFGFDWPIKPKIVSKRDNSLPLFIK